MKHKTTDKKVAEVFESMDYDKFSTLKGNRIIKSIHVTRLIASFESEYLMSPIIVNEAFEIIDGQHRFESAKSLSLPVRYICVPGYGLDQVQRLNTNMENWKSVDYLNAFCELGYSEYLRFRDFMGRFQDFGISACQLILQDTPTTVRRESKDGGNIVIKDFKNGDFKVRDMKKSIVTAEMLVSIGDKYDGFDRVTFIRAMISIFNIDGYDHKRLLKKLYRNPSKLTHCNSVSQYRELVEDIYNYGQGDGTRLNLRF